MFKIIGIALLLTLNAYIVLKYHLSRNSSSDTHTWIGHDFPPKLPLSHEPETVRMITEETAFYPLGESGHNAWQSLLPASGLYVRLGPRRRLFIITMFHELHCLQILNYGFASGVERGHILHCLTYLRHGALCAADRTMEPGDFAKRNFTACDSAGTEHRCRDWSQIYALYDENWSAWKAASKGR